MNELFEKKDIIWSILRKKITCLEIGWHNNRNRKAENIGQTEVKTDINNPAKSKKCTEQIRWCCMEL